MSFLGAEVVEEVKRLERLKPRLMQLNDGRDLHAALNAQVRVLEQGLCDGCVR